MCKSSQGDHKKKTLVWVQIVVIAVIMRNCKDCGINIDHRAPQAKRCTECSYKKKRKELKEKYDKSDHSERKFNHTCEMCKCLFVTYHKQSRLCKQCRIKNSKVNHTGYETFYGGKLAFIHKAIAMVILGDELQDKVVHHLDGNGKNNRDLTNLIVLSSSNHAKLHHYITYIPHDNLIELSLKWLKDNNVNFIRLSERYNGTWDELMSSIEKLKPQPQPREVYQPKKTVFNKKIKLIKKFTCSNCKLEFPMRSKNQKYCSYACNHIARRKTTRPDVLSLEKMVWEVSTSKIANHFGVTDNAVAKWCKIYGIPKPPRGYWAKIKSRASDATG